MINIMHAIFPIRKFSLVLTHLCCRSIVPWHYFLLPLLWLYLVRLIYGLVSGGQIHLMGIYDFMLDFRVEYCDLTCWLIHLLEFLLVVSYHIFRIRVFHEPITASISAPT